MEIIARLLGIVLLLEIAIGPRMSILSWFDIAPPAAWVRNGRRLGLFEGSLFGMATVLGAAGTQMLWGFYQEVIYRGLLQTELTRR